MSSRIRSLFLCFGFLVFIMGCHILLVEQEWSQNYALLDGTQASIPTMIDGDLNTSGETQYIHGVGEQYGSSWGTGVSIKLPEKKHIRRIVIHTDNIKKLKIFADKGGTMLSETDWDLIKEIKGVKSTPIVIPLFTSYAIDHLRILVSDTTDDDARNRQDKADFYREEEERRRRGERTTGGNFSSFEERRRFEGRYSYPGTISEIEIYGYKSAEETAAGKPQAQREDELDSLLKQD